MKLPVQEIQHANITNKMGVNFTSTCLIVLWLSFARERENTSRSHRRFFAQWAFRTLFVSSRVYALEAPDFSPGARLAKGRTRENRMTLARTHPAWDLPAVLLDGLARRSQVFLGEGRVAYSLALQSR